MNWLDSILQSPIARDLAVVIGVLAGLSALFARALPNPALTRRVAVSCLAAVGLLLVAMLFGLPTAGVVFVVILALGIPAYLSAVQLRALNQQNSTILSKLETALSLLGTQPDQQVAQTVSTIKSHFDQQFGQLSVSLDYSLDKLKSHLARQPVDQAKDKAEDKKGHTDRPSLGENAYKYSAMRYGMGHGELKVSCTIRKDGSASIVRQVTVEAYSQLSRLETSLIIPEPPPSGKKRGFSSPPRIEPTTDYNVSLVKAVERERKQFAEIAFSPELHEDEIGGFKMTEEISPGVYAIDLSEEDIANRKTPYDYFGWNIDRPTRSLHLWVYFPDGVKPVVYGAEVHYTPVVQDIATTRVQYEEQKRITGPSLVGPEGGRYTLRLDVDFPMIGLIYIVRWQPVPRKTGETIETVT